MASIDVSGWLDDDELKLEHVPSKKHPVEKGGGTYTVPSLSAADGVLLARVAEGSSDDLSVSWSPDAQAALKAFCTDDDGNEITLQAKLFGTAYDEMLADGVSNNRMHALVGVVTQHALSGLDTARMFVAMETAKLAGQTGDAAGEAEARPNRATRRAAAKKPSSPRKAGSSSSRASGAKSTRTSPATSPGSESSDPEPEATKTA